MTDSCAMSEAEFCADYLVVRDDFTEDEVRRFAGDLGWELLSDVREQDGVRLDLAWHVADGVLFEYLVEERVGCAVVIIRGPSERLVRDIVGILEPRLNPWSIRDLIKAVDAARAPAERAVALIRLGLGAPRQYHVRKIVKRIERGVRDEHDDVRLAAVCAAGYTGWPVFMPLLNQVADEGTGVAQTRAAVIAASLGYR